MGAAVAFGTTLDSDVIKVICSFLDDSSMLGRCGTDASDVGNQDDFCSYLGWSREIRCRRNAWIQRSLYRESMEYPNGL